MAFRTTANSVARLSDAEKGASEVDEWDNETRRNSVSSNKLGQGNKNHKGKHVDAGQHVKVYVM
jgi:hypothetical protein